MGCDLRLLRFKVAKSSVSIHAPAWGATIRFTRFVSASLWFQSTHPRGVRRFFAVSSARSSWVSIHAPAWGATAAFASATRQRMVSIHAPAWGATRMKKPKLALIACFNPRTRVGCDKSRFSATRTSMMFQSTHPRGVRPASRASSMGTLPVFQSTHPRGVRHVPQKTVVCVRRVSIHAPAWGATPAGAWPRKRSEVSIHAPAWGATVSMFYPVDSRD